MGPYSIGGVTPRPAAECKVIPHGTWAGYVSYGCTCPECLAWQAAKKRRQRANNLARYRERDRKRMAAWRAKQKAES